MLLKLPWAFLAQTVVEHAVSCAMRLRYVTGRACPPDLNRSTRRVPQAIAMWLGMDDLQHCLVIGAYFNYCGGWTPAQAFDVSPTGPKTNDPLFVVQATKK